MEQVIEQIKSCRTVECAVAMLKSYGDTHNIRKAIDFTVKKHEGQLRKSGEAYAIHPILVSAIVAHLGGDEDMIVAGLLHDVIEDTCCNIHEVTKEFNPEVATLVEGLTKIMEIRDVELVPSHSNEKMISSALTFRKMLLASISDVRVLVIKLCDRLHNMITLQALSEAKQKRISEETMVVYAPIAHRLGISSIKNLLEDYSFLSLTW